MSLADINYVKWGAEKLDWSPPPLIIEADNIEAKS